MHEVQNGMTHPHNITNSIAESAFHDLYTSGLKISRTVGTKKNFVEKLYCESVTVLRNYKQQMKEHLNGSKNLIFLQNATNNYLSNELN